MPSDFVHLHMHSRFSFGDGACDLDDVIARVLEFGMSALALTDHQGLYGAIRFYRKARTTGLKPILGAEVVVQAAGIPGEESDLPPETRLQLPAGVGSARAAGRGWHLTLLVRDISGYRNLCRLLSRAHIRSADEPSVVSLRDLARCSEGLIALSGCRNGEIGASILAGDLARARGATERLRACFAPGDFYVELSHSLTPDAPRYISDLVSLADSLGLPVVATNDVHYVRPAGFRVHDVLSSAGARMALPGPYDRPNAELYLKSAAEMRALFPG
ncbi:MAG: PHP domain-containing protein, partial [Coriobacteriia bacterium]|nr:PHP domain-containing protein [Coriobacteriia bacterium]